ncbi:MAG: TIGR03617 family F420-dependent LLM class oxidoreductase [Gammaproteobacteria bacterium]|nr:TIGR03617 family F420-dependent LLM class oxidoreductase [Gammaproteobacteria bacterium]
MQVATSIVQHDLRRSAEVAAAAEATGYDIAQSMENQHDPYLVLAAACTSTRRIELTPSIALSFVRSPVATAYAAYDLHVSSDGRFVLGLGSQVKGHNERRYSVPWTPAATRMREVIEVIQAVWRCWELGEPLDYAGEQYRVNLMPPNFRPKSSGLGRIPIAIAAVGPAMLRLAGSHCDAVYLHPFCTRAYVENVVMPELQTGFERGGRTREQFRISGGGFLATGPDEAAVAERVEWVRQRVAFYGSTRSYHGVLAQHGLEDLGMKLYEMSKVGAWDKMAAEVSDEVVALFAAIGTYDRIEAEIKSRFGGVSDVISEGNGYGRAPQLPPDLIADIRRIPTSFSGFDRSW